MFNFFSTFTSPALQAQIDAQMSLAMDISKRMFDSVQKINELNLQVVTTLYKESLVSAQQMFASNNKDQSVTIEADTPPPVAEKVRSYQQHLQNIFAEAQAGMTLTLESHVPETVRASEEVASEVIQKVSEEAMKAIQLQTQVLEQLAVPAQVNLERAEEEPSRKAEQ